MQGCQPRRKERVREMTPSTPFKRRGYALDETGVIVQKQEQIISSSGPRGSIRKLAGGSLFSQRRSTTSHDGLHSFSTLVRFVADILLCLVHLPR